MATAKYAGCQFVVKRSGGDRPFIALTPLNEDWEKAGLPPISFALADGVDFDDAEQLAHLLDEKLKYLMVTD